MSTPDFIDEQLARLLAQDAQQNSQTLSKQLNISSTTVRRRLRNLIKNGSLRIIGVINPEHFNLGLAVVIAIDASYDKLELAVRTLSEKHEVTWATTTSGRYNIIAIARFPSTKVLASFLAKDLFKIPGIRNSETFICLNFWKGLYLPYV